MYTPCRDGVGGCGSRAAICAMGSITAACSVWDTGAFLLTRRVHGQGHRGRSPSRRRDRRALDWSISIASPVPPSRCGSQASTASTRNLWPSSIPGGRQIGRTGDLIVSGCRDIIQNALTIDGSDIRAQPVPRSSGSIARGNRPPATNYDCHGLRELDGCRCARRPCRRRRGARARGRPGLGLRTLLDAVASPLGIASAARSSSATDRGAASRSSRRMGSMPPRRPVSPRRCNGRPTRSR